MADWLMAAEDHRRLASLLERVGYALLKVPVDDERLRVLNLRAQADDSEFLLPWHISDLDGMLLDTSLNELREEMTIGELLDEFLDEIAIIIANEGDAAA